MRPYKHPPEEIFRDIADPPCNTDRDGRGCHWRYYCKTNRLACAAFRHYVRTNQGAGATVRELRRKGLQSIDVVVEG